MSLIDLPALGTWMTAHVPGFSGPLEAEKYSGGQSNPTFLLRAGTARYVLRRKPGGVLLKSAHAVEREYRVQSALMGTAVPVPRMIALCEDDTIIGSAFYLMDEVAGHAHDDPRLPGCTAHQRSTIMTEMAHVLAAIHDTDPGRAGLADYGPPGDYFARQTARWTRQYRASETAPIPDMDRLIAWLETHMPPDDGQRTLVHGDYRLDNLLFSPEGRCTAVLDWELSTLGHPYADLAGVVMQWSMPPGPEGRGLAGVDRAALGLPSDAEFVALYCARRGLDRIATWDFCLAFSFFRMAAILQGVKRRALDGNASDPERALRLGAHVPAFAAKGLAAATGGTECP